jgi:hypothetical protein
MKDEALEIPNTRLIAAIYFALLAVLFTFAFDLFLVAFGVQELMPTFKSVLLATVIAAVFGGIFGEKIIHCSEPHNKKAFLWGFLMVITALPVYALGLLYLFQESLGHLYSGNGFMHYLTLYLSLLFYSFILGGVWLAIASGLASIYLRSYLVYDLMHTKHLKDDKPRKKSTVKRKAHSHTMH